MKTTTTRNVNEMPETDREALEALLGQPLRADQQVFVMAYTPGLIPDAQTREAARKTLQQTFEAVDRHAQEQGIDPTEAETAIDQALDQLRPRNN